MESITFKSRMDKEYTKSEISSEYVESITEGIVFNKMMTKKRLNYLINRQLYAYPIYTGSDNRHPTYSSNFSKMQTSARLKKDRADQLYIAVESIGTTRNFVGVLVMFEDEHVLTIFNHQDTFMKGPHNLSLMINYKEINALMV